MITDAQWAAWLQDDSALRCILIEVTPYLSGVDTPLYLSSKDFVTKPSDTPANTGYLPIIQGSVKVSEQFSVDGSASMSYGSVELDNVDGTYDTWLDGVWSNRKAAVLFGDVTWPRTDFRIVFKGVIDDIDSSGITRLNLKLRDNLQLLNTPVTETKLGGTTDNKDRLRPVLVGEGFNFEPLLVDPPNHGYQFHFGASERVIEIRDDGVPITAAVDLSTGTLNLLASPKGTITISAQGDNSGGYSSTVAGIVKKLVKNYGRVDSRFTDDDIDLTNFSNFETANPAPVGMYLSDKANVLETCQTIAASVGAMLMSSRQGLLQLVQLNAAVGAANATVVTEDDMVVGSLRIVERTKVVASVKLGFCENYTVQTKVQTGIPEAHKNLFELDWMTTTQSDSNVSNTYKLHTVPETEETRLLAESDAISEANRRLNLRKVQRTVYQYTGFADSLDLKLGNEVFLKHHRYGLSAGKYGVIVGLEPDWLARRCIVKVMI